MIDDKKARRFWKKHSLLMKLGFKFGLIGGYSDFFIKRLRDDGFEVVETKGKGHPDNICDTLAEKISVSRGLNPDAPRALKKVTITK